MEKRGYIILFKIKAGVIRLEHGAPSLRAANPFVRLVNDTGIIS